jgi:hypothetical protein
MTTAEMDRCLHAARLDGQDQRRHSALARDLPDGTMVLIDDATHLVRAAQALRWGPGGYATAGPLPDGQVTVLTPAPMVAVMQAGWRPVLHFSAIGASAVEDGAGESA